MKAMELLDARVEVRREGARSELKSLGVSDARISDYFRCHAASLLHLPYAAVRSLVTPRSCLRFGDGRVMLDRVP